MLHYVIDTFRSSLRSRIIWKRLWFWKGNLWGFRLRLFGKFKQYMKTYNVLCGSVFIKIFLLRHPGSVKLIISDHIQYDGVMVFDRNE
jgi:hypothetical protein